MQTKGKFYIRLDDASMGNWFWKQSAQNWTSIASEATFFDTEEDAAAEAEAAQVYCDEHSMGEANVYQATKDLQEA